MKNCPLKNGSCVNDCVMRNQDGSCVFRKAAEAMVLAVGKMLDMQEQENKGKTKTTGGKKREDSEQPAHSRRGI